MSADDIPAALLQVVRQISAEHFQGGDMFVAAAPESVPPRPAAAGQSDITTGDSVVYVRPPAGSVQDVDDQTIVALADKRTPDPVRFTTHPVPNTDPVRSVLGVLGRECTASSPVRDWVRRVPAPRRGDWAGLGGADFCAGRS